MEVFVRDVPEQITEKGLRNLIGPYMEKLSIQTYLCGKQRQKRFAFVTFLHVEDGQRFLQAHGKDKVLPTLRVMVPIKLLGTQVTCSLSNGVVNAHSVRSLAKEEKDRISQARKPAVQIPKAKPDTATAFACRSVRCGVWGYSESDLCFISYFNLVSYGVGKFGSRSLTLLCTSDSNRRIDFLYSNIKSMTTEESPHRSITLTLWTAPMIYELSNEDSMEDLSSQMAELSVGKQGNAKRTRIASLDSGHDQIVGSAFVYRLSLTGKSDEFRKHLRQLQDNPTIPSTIHRQTRIDNPTKSFAQEQRRLATKLQSSTVPWKIQYQLWSLATSGTLTATQVIRIIPQTERILARTSLDMTAAALRRLFSQILCPGLDVEAHEFEREAIHARLEKIEVQLKKEEEMFSAEERPNSSESLAMIHRAMITPSGMYLYGPDSEPMNRVLRKYPKRHEYFLRVQFCDEDGEPVRFNPRVSNDSIFHARFKDVLENGITIVNRKFDFLGFSHSSLRAQSCWFMAPFAHDGSLMYDRMLIAQLGDFSKIRCPAKCAARIGQAFSDTPTAVTIARNVVKGMKDIQVGARIFSDGVGTISKSVMYSIWDALPEIGKSEPTCFQIRYQGAKGMLSLDSRLTGDQVFLRPSMIKFEGSNSQDLELCGASYKPLPLYLNRQSIKILEDMGVDDQWFLDLQSQEMERLRSATANASNAAKFLTSHSIGDRVHLPWFIKKLSSMNLDFRADRFLCNVLEMSVLIEVKSLKHRARYPVPSGMTLYGVMDETGFLEENQIYCTFQQNGRRGVVTAQNVLITKSPALYPGDIQIVDAVNAPPASPLLQLKNCICFSQKGERDLPSKLSGGDLDGDFYHIIWDGACKPERSFAPADYPRQVPMDIGRKVERSDMTDFFITFMETDQLGRIATSHQVLADQRELGTMDPDCRLLAEMHSTAVDFSKTGVPVNMKQMPKFSPIRPDFMAMGNLVRVEKKEGLLLEASAPATQESSNDDDDFSPYRYYESDKILGKLYRAIDEHEIFDEIKRYRALSGDNSTVLRHVWAYVERKYRNLLWAEHLSWAHNLCDMYEDNLLTTMTQYSEHPSRPISELEAFIGNILGATGSQSKRQRDLSVTMKEKFDADASYYVECIVNNDEGMRAEDALERSMACLAAYLERQKSFVGAGRIGDMLVSFGYVAAAVCLRELEADMG